MFLLSWLIIKVVNKYWQSIVFYESLLDYWAIIPEQIKQTRSRKSSTCSILKIEELQHDIEEDYEMHALNNSMLHIFSDYIEEWEFDDIQKAQVFGGK